MTKSDLEHAVEESKELTDERIKYLNQISSDIKYLEGHIRSLGLDKNICFEQEGVSFYWDINECRLMAYDKPLLEHKTYVRIAAHRHLIEFLKLINKYISS